MRLIQNLEHYQGAPLLKNSNRVFSLLEMWRSGIGRRIHPLTHFSYHLQYLKTLHQTWLIQRCSGADVLEFFLSQNAPRSTSAHVLRKELQQCSWLPYAQSSPQPHILLSAAVRPSAQQLRLSTPTGVFCIPSCWPNTPAAAAAACRHDTS